MSDDILSGGVEEVICASFNNKLRIIYHNVEGLSQDKLSLECADLLDSSDIVCFAETWLSEATAANINIEGFEKFSIENKRRARHGRNSGGIMVFIRNALIRCIRRWKPQANGVMYFIVELNSTKIGLIFLYNPPTGSPYANEEQLDEIEEELISLERMGVDEFLLMGDFNARTATVDDRVPVDQLDDDEDTDLPDIQAVTIPERASMDRVCNDRGLRLIDFVKSASLCILNGRKRGDETGDYTYSATQGNSVIDYGISSLSLYPEVDVFEIVEGCFSSSHHPIRAEIEMRDALPVDEEIVDRNEERHETIFKYRWDPIKASVFVTRILAALSMLMVKCASFCALGNLTFAVDEIVKFVQDTGKLFRINHGSYQRSKMGPKWWTSSCHVAKDAWRRARREMKRLKTEGSIRNLLEAKKNYKNVKSKAICEYKEKERQNILALKDENDMKGMWKKIKMILKPRVNSRTTLISSRKWLNHFQDVFNFKIVDDRDEWVLPEDVDDGEDSTLDSEVTSEEIKSAIERLKNGKAAGEDGITPEMIKTAGSYMLALLANLFTHMLNACTYPAQWVKAIVVPLYKGKGSLKEAVNYRGISLLPHLAKVFTHILNRRITRWLNDKRAIVDEQAGFREGYGTHDNVFVMDALIRRRLSKRKQKLYVCYVDFKRAFDSVPRSALWYKLYLLGMRGKLFKLLRDMYSKCSFAVRITSAKITEKRESTSGVFQGCLISPTLFKVFINDVIKYCADESNGSVDAPEMNGRKVPGLLFADDLTLMSTTVEGLQRMIDRLSEYAEYWGLEVSVEKTKCMVFRKGGRLAARERWFYRGGPIEIVKNFKFLGYWMSPKLVWTYHGSVQSAKAMGALYQLRKLVCNQTTLPLKLLWHLFDTLVGSVVLYGSEVWGGTTKKGNLQKVDGKFVKYLLRLPQGSPTAAVLLEIKKFNTLFVKAKLRPIKYWLRLLKTPEDRLAKIAYREQRKLDTEGIESWATGVRQTLEEAGMGHLWESERIFQPDRMIDTLTRALESKEKIDLVETAIGKPSLYDYNQKTRGEGLPLEVMNMPSNRRRLIIAARLNLPTFCERVNVNAEIGWRCQICKTSVTHKWDHIFFECHLLRQERIQAGLRTVGILADEGSNFIFGEDYVKIEVASEYLVLAMRKMKRLIK